MRLGKLPTPLPAFPHRGGRYASRSARARRLCARLVGPWLLLVAGAALAQQLPIDLDPLRSARSASAAEAADARAAQARDAAMPSPTMTPRDTGVDAAALLDGGQALTAAELPMFGEQLFRGTAQAYGVGFNREAVAERQREMLDISLRVLETYALTAHSATSEEATLRAREAEQITRFIERARSVEPRGQVVLAGHQTAMETLLQDGEVIVIPERSNIVMVHGEVTQPSAIAYEPGADVRDYIQMAGGTTQRLRNTRVLRVRRDGSFIEDRRAEPMPGDEILVLPKVALKNVEIARGITQILYQLAIAARVVIDL